MNDFQHFSAHRIINITSADFNANTKDISIRQAVNTELHVFNDKLIQEAVQFELDRGGQVFFIHNRVNDLKRWAVYDDVINGFKPQGAHYQEFFDYFNNVPQLMADGFNSTDANRCKLTQGTNFDIDAEGYINPFFRVPEFRSSGTGYYIEPGRAYLSPIPRAEIDLYLEKGNVTLTQNPGWF